MYFCFRKSAGWIFFYHSPTCIVERVSEYIILISKNKQTSKGNKDAKKVKEAKEENRIYTENGLKINKFAAAQVMIFLVTRVSGKKIIFLPIYPLIVMADLINSYVLLSENFLFLECLWRSRIYFIRCFINSTEIKQNHFCWIFLKCHKYLPRDICKMSQR